MSSLSEKLVRLWRQRRFVKHHWSCASTDKYQQLLSTSQSLLLELTSLPWNFPINKSGKSAKKYRTSPWHNFWTDDPWTIIETLRHLYNMFSSELFIWFHPCLTQKLSKENVLGTCYLNSRLHLLTRFESLRKSDDPDMSFALQFPKLTMFRCFPCLETEKVGFDHYSYCETKNSLMKIYQRRSQ